MSIAGRQHLHPKVNLPPANSAHRCLAVMISSSLAAFKLRASCSCDLSTCSSSDSDPLSVDTHEQPESVDYH